VVVKSRTRILAGCGLWLLASFFVLGSTLPGSAEDRESVCFEVKNEWEQSMAEIKDSLREFKSLQKTPVRDIIDRPVVLRSSSKTIAQQVSECLQAKERVLNRQREKCRQALSREREVFSKLEACLTASSTSKNGPKISRLNKKRSGMVDNAVALLSKVREVEGQELYPSYANMWGYGYPYYQSYQQPPATPNRYFNQYRRMYRGWWGR
jgi:hypothetical protein